MPPIGRSFLPIVIFFTFSVYGLYGQNNYIPGYVKLNDQSIIQGYIEDSQKASVASFLFCRFREKPDGDILVYAPEDILEYGYSGGKRYLTKSIFWKDNQQLVFLNLIEEGKLSLFTAFDRFFISLNSNQYEIKTLERDEIDKMFLANLLADCNGIKSLVNNTKATRERLERLVQAYNNCFLNSNPGNLEKEKEHALEIGPFYGFEISTITCKGSTNFLKNLKLTDSNPVLFGLNVNLYPFKFRKYSFQTGVWFVQDRFFVTTSESTSNTNTINEFYLESKSLKVPLVLKMEELLKFEYFSLYAKGGIINIFPLSVNSFIKRETDSNNVVTIDEIKVLESFKEPLAFIVACGVDFPEKGRIKGFVEMNYSVAKKKYSLSSDQVDFGFQSIRFLGGIRF